MVLDDLLVRLGEWLKGEGLNSDIVMSSRVRLARNVDKIPFTHWASKKEKEDILEIIKNVLKESEFLKDGIFLLLKEIDEIDRIFLLERHLVSHEFIQKPNSKAVAVSTNEMVSGMINEEDHLRLQVMQSGFNISGAFEIARKLDEFLSEKIKFAFSSEWGYLTACPTNVGTGLRASVMLHLPVLVFTKQINKVLQAITRLGLTARGFYGEGTEATGNFFQISNQVTLGQKEEDIVDNLEKIIKQVVEYEQNARQMIMTQEKERITDRIWRAYGVLKNAYIISSNETIELLSHVRLGVDLGIIKDITRRQLNELFIFIQPAHLQKLEGKKLTPQQRDVKRAQLIRNKLGVI
ncbi:MAG: protein arginine kinase [Candidatus Omnitrophica bacterium]|nr:protein arginine kinase [Candidatus Omnitrophota bacterium]MCM8783637.1 protein arginine kinase [Candidatus Omnitrophota bacterium]